MGQAGTAGDDGTLRISNIHAKIAREEDLLGTITPYLVRPPAQSVRVRMLFSAQLLAK
jgi:hypothetical protein